jgi:hypothetical protein
LPCLPSERHKPNAGVLRPCYETGCEEASPALHAPAVLSIVAFAGSLLLGIGRGQRSQVGHDRQRIGVVHVIDVHGLPDRKAVRTDASL